MATLTIAQLKAEIDAYIKTNGVRAITGDQTNQRLNDMVDNLYRLSNRIFKQPTEPTVDDLNLNDLWIKDDTGDVYIYSGTVWTIYAGFVPSEWSKGTASYGKYLAPKDATVKEIRVFDNAQGLTQMYLKNTNDVDNFAGAVISLEGSGAEYTNYASLAKYGSGYYIVSWADRAVLASDKQIVVSSEDSIMFQTGGTTGNPIDRFQIESNGTLKSETANYETLITEDNDIPNKKYVDDNSGGNFEATVGEGGDYLTIREAVADDKYILQAVGSITETGTSLSLFRKFYLDLNGQLLNTGTLYFTGSKPFEILGPGILDFNNPSGGKLLNITGFAHQIKLTNIVMRNYSTNNSKIANSGTFTDLRIITSIDGVNKGFGDGQALYPRTLELRKIQFYGGGTQLINSSRFGDIIEDIELNAVESIEVVNASRITTLSNTTLCTIYQNNIGFIGVIDSVTDVGTTNNSGVVVTTKLINANVGGILATTDNVDIEGCIADTIDIFGDYCKLINSDATTITKTATTVVSMVGADSYSILPSLGTFKQEFTPGATTQTIDLSVGSYIKLDLTSATGDVTLTLTNPLEGATYAFRIVQPAISKDIIFPVGTTTLNGGGDTVLGITSAVQLVVAFYDGSNFIITKGSEVI